MCDKMIDRWLQWVHHDVSLLCVKMRRAQLWNFEARMFLLRRVILLCQEQLETVFMGEESTARTDGQGSWLFPVAKITMRVNVCRAQLVCVLVQQCFLELGIGWFGMQFLDEIWRWEGQLTPPWTPRHMQKENNVFADWVGIGAIARDRLFWHGNNAGIACWS